MSSIGPKMEVAPKSFLNPSIPSYKNRATKITRLKLTNKRKHMPQAQEIKITLEMNKIENRKTTVINRQKQKLGYQKDQQK